MPGGRRRARGNITQLPSGSWRVTVEGGTDPLTGRRRQLRETVKTRAEAKVLLTKLQRLVDEGKHPKSAVTMRQVVEQGSRPPNSKTRPASATRT